MNKRLNADKRDRAMEYFSGTIIKDIAARARNGLYTLSITPDSDGAPSHTDVALAEEIVNVLSEYHFTGGMNTANTRTPFGRIWMSIDISW